MGGISEDEEGEKMCAHCYRDSRSVEQSANLYQVGNRA